MKKLVYLLFLFLLVGSSFTYHDANEHRPFANKTQKLKLDIKIEQPQTSTSNDGALILTVSGGSAPYTIQVISTFNPSQVYKKDKIEIKKLGVGDYIIMVQDAEKQVVQETIELKPVQ